MSLERLKRVIWRLQEKGVAKIPLKLLRRSIMEECGTDERTIQHNITRLLELEWLKRTSRHSFYIGEEYKEV